METNALNMLIVPACQAVVAGLAGGYVIKSMVDAFHAFCGLVNHPSEVPVAQSPIRDDLNF